jgi:hypothetical protein
MKAMKERALPVRNAAAQFLSNTLDAQTEFLSNTLEESGRHMEGNPGRQ